MSIENLKTDADQVSQDREDAYLDEEAIKAELELETVRYRKIFDELDAENSFADRLPNSGAKYDNDAQFSDLLRYMRRITQPQNSSFWRE